MDWIGIDRTNKTVHSLLQDHFGDESLPEVLDTDKHPRLDTEWVLSRTVAYCAAGHWTFLCVAGAFVPVLERLFPNYARGTRSKNGLCHSKRALQLCSSIGISVHGIPYAPRGAGNVLVVWYLEHKRHTSVLLAELRLLRLILLPPKYGSEQLLHK